MNMLGEYLSFFSGKVEEKVIEAMTSKGQRTIIQELEMMAVLGALKSWEVDLGRHRVLLFTERGCQKIISQKRVSQRRQ